MANIVSVTEVKDFDQWKPQFERFEAVRNESGVRNPRIFRFRSNPNRFVVLFDVDDVERALSGLTSDRVRGVMKDIGVTSIEFAVPSAVPTQQTVT